MRELMVRIRATFPCIKEMVVVLPKPLMREDGPDVLGEIGAQQRPHNICINKN